MGNQQEVIGWSLGGRRRVGQCIASVYLTCAQLARRPRPAPSLASNAVADLDRRCQDTVAGRE